MCRKVWSHVSKVWGNAQNFGNLSILRCTLGLLRPKMQIIHDAVQERVNFYYWREIPTIPSSTNNALKKGIAYVCQLTSTSQSAQCS